MTPTTFAFLTGAGSVLLVLALAWLLVWMGVE